ncbi:helix-turn-helix domain-containing protein [Sphingobacterium daejeonense]|uniref:helix-turn-helix domain-containing protein n=1 Tax=Sphingobacterium daejeonense TaxID=371142 RepID=UPI0010C32F19|nr:DNA-binding transcriptional activator GcvA [Sphingobacterium daejeonense]
MLEINFRIKVFYHAARDLSFTKASRELNISQPAVSKHIQEFGTYDWSGFIYKKRQQIGFDGSWFYSFGIRAGHYSRI